MYSDYSFSSLNSPQILPNFPSTQFHTFFLYVFRKQKANKPNFFLKNQQQKIRHKKHKKQN